MYKSSGKAIAQNTVNFAHTPNDNHVAPQKPFYQSFVKKSESRKPALDQRFRMLKDQEKIRRQKNTLPNIIHCD